MDSQSSIPICPRCGATMNTYGFSCVCIFCGYIEGNDEIESGPINRLDVCSRYHYLEYNSKYLATKRDYITVFQKYIIKSKTSFYPHNGYSKISSIPISLFYENNNENEELRIYLHLLLPETNPYIVFQTSNQKRIYLHFSYEDTDGLYALLSIRSFYELCQSRKLFYATNCFSLKYDFSEFSTYCARFYNIVFNRNRFGYSLNKKLITD